MDMHPFTNEDWDCLPHVALGLETTWDPQVLDLEQSNDPGGFEHVTLMHMGITVTALLKVQHPYLLTLMHMEITVTALLRAPHPCLLMKRPLKITKSIPPSHGHL
jgi:hypothetical protein